MRRHHAARLGVSSRGDVFRQLQMHRPRPLLLRDPEGLAHDASGSWPRLTIWRDILVSGFIAAMMSTIWKRACRPLMIAFWPVIMTIGMAPRCA